MVENLHSEEDGYKFYTISITSLEQLREELFEIQETDTCNYLVYCDTQHISEDLIYQIENEARHSSVSDVIWCRLVLCDNNQDVENFISFSKSSWRKYIEKIQVYQHRNLWI